MPGPSQTRQIGWALRIYKNSRDRVLGLDDIAIVENTRNRNANQQILRSAYKTVKHTDIRLVDGTRQITKIQMLGNYDSVTTSGYSVSGVSGLVTNFMSATWEGTEDSNDIEISFNDLFEPGDEI